MYIGTRAFTVEVDTGRQSINKYTYYVDDDKKAESDKNTFSIENLEPESTHTVKVFIEKQNGTSEELEELTITTEPITYLYKDGVANTEISGEFQGKIQSTNDRLPGNVTYFEGNGTYSSAQINREPYISISTAHSGPNNFGLTNVTLISANKINFSEYRKLYIQGSFSTSYNAGYYIGLEKENDEGTAFARPSLNTELNLTDIKETGHIVFRVFSTYTQGTTGNLTIREIRLEK